jgi:diadenosine tetraphosphate (Ap4A) HIT family hydrolase
MKSDLPQPFDDAIIFEDDVYACLANYPITRGHVVVVWKHTAKDLHELPNTEYDHLMDVVQMVRSAMLQALLIDKVYLTYLDETKQVHWQLIPRYNEKGYNILIHEPAQLQDCSLAETIREYLDISKLD